MLFRFKIRKSRAVKVQGANPVGREEHSQDKSLTQKLTEPDPVGRVVVIVAVEGM